jgi:hypothetical protein
MHNALTNRRARRAAASAGVQFNEAAFLRMLEARMRAGGMREIVRLEGDPDQVRFGFARVTAPTPSRGCLAEARSSRREPRPVRRVVRRASANARAPGRRSDDDEPADLTRRAA